MATKHFCDICDREILNFKERSIRVEILGAVHPHKEEYLHRDVDFCLDCLLHSAGVRIDQDLETLRANSRLLASRAAIGAATKQSLFLKDEHNTAKTENGTG